jgi:hypothetical protein
MSYVPLASLQERFGATSKTLKARALRAGLPLYNLNPGGHPRWALVEEDVERLAVARVPAKPAPYFPQHEPTMEDVMRRLHGR